MENTNYTNYEDLYDQISSILVWLELVPIPFTIASSVSWIIIAIWLLRKNDIWNASASHLESLRVHYITSLHRKRVIKYVILLIAINLILTDITLTGRTVYQTYQIITHHHNNDTYQNITHHHNNDTYCWESGQWANYRHYDWLYIAWFVPSMTFTQSYYWSVALLPIATKAYFNLNSGTKHFIAVFIFIFTRGALLAILWLIPYTIPFGVVICIVTLAFDWLLIMYFFISAYFVAKNRIRAFVEGLDERDAIDNKFISKLRFLYLTFCLILSLIFASMLQGMIVEFLLPMVVYPNSWLYIYGKQNTTEPFGGIGEKYKSTFTLIQLVSVLEIRVLIILCRIVYLMLSGVSFLFIHRFKFKQRNGKKLKKKRNPNDSTPLIVEN